MIQLVLPYPPTLNHFYARSGTKLYRVKAYTDFIGYVSWLFKTQSPADWKKTGRFSVKIDVYPPDRRKRDLDNLVKPIFDALTQGGAWNDDSQIDKFLVRRQAPNKDNPRVVVEIFKGLATDYF